MTRRDDLVGRFFAATDAASHPIATHVDDVEVDLIVDGDRYFTEIFDAIAGTTSGDDVLIVGWTFETTMRKGTHPEIGDLLAARKAAGVNVHVVLNGSLYQNALGSPFQQSLDALIDLREKRIPAGSTTPPLDACVLFDFSGAPVTGSHHQKVVIVRRGTDTVAYVGGIDLWHDRDDTNDHPGTALPQWGWHDAVMRLRGKPVADAWANFVSRYDEARTLPVRNAWRSGSGLKPIKLKPYNPATATPLPPMPATFAPLTPTPDVAVQVLRSRFPLKLPREKPPTPWAFPPAGGIRQVHATLHKALGAAERYIYIEDQFIADSFENDDPAAKAHSLLPDLLAAAKKGVKIIMVTSGKTDTPWLPRTLPPAGLKTEVLDRLTAAQQANISIWKLTTLMVHSKLIMIDDVFCAVGSANLHSRSMYGIDQELHVAVVDAAIDGGGAPAGVIRDWRVRIWAEHLEVLGSHAPFQAQLENIDTALGMWRRSWLVGGTPNMWFVSGNPPGFAPTRVRRSFVGPPPTES